MSARTTQHAPGPWRVGFDDGSGPEFITAEGSERGPFALPDVVAIVGHHGDPCITSDVTETEHANARLIAAAPELLDALEAALASIPNLPGLGERARYVRSVRKAAEAAIAKARGEVKP